MLFGASVCTIVYCVQVILFFFYKSLQFKKHLNDNDLHGCKLKPKAAAMNNGLFRNQHDWNTTGFHPFKKRADPVWTGSLSLWPGSVCEGELTLSVDWFSLWTGSVCEGDLTLSVAWFSL